MLTRVTSWWILQEFIDFTVQVFNGLFRSSKQVDPLKIMSIQKMILSSLESHVNGWKPLHDRDTIVNTTIEAIRQKFDKLKVNGKHASTFNETFW